MTDIKRKEQYCVGKEQNVIAQSLKKKRAKNRIMRILQPQSQVMDGK